MDKETVFEDFFKSLRIAFNNSTVYFKDHPIFLTTIESLKQKIYAVFEFTCPLSMGVTPNSLLVSGKYWEKEALYVDIAHFLHRRKIKSIEFRKNVSATELNVFISKASLPLIDLIRGGGLSKILEQEGVSNISVEELDYYSLLKAIGAAEEERKDVWIYLLNRAIKEENKNEIEALGDNFGNILNNFNVEDFLKNDDLLNTMNSFLEYLKRTNSTRLGECSRESFKMVLRNKSLISKDNIPRIKEILKHLNDNDVCVVLLDKMLTDDNFDTQNMELFSMLIGEKQHAAMSVPLEEKISKDPRLNAKNARKIQELFSGISDPVITTIYKEALSMVIEKAVQKEGMVLDRSTLNYNFRLLLLNLLDQESQEDELISIVEKIMQELPKIIDDQNTEAIGYLLKTFQDKKHSLPKLKTFFEGMHAKVIVFLEEAISLSAVDLHSFDVFLNKTSLGKEFYLKKIFEEKTFNMNILRLFMKFFPDQLEELYERIKAKRDDLNFLRKLIYTLKDIDIVQTQSVLIYIFKFANQFIKTEILKAMQNLSTYDEGFLMLILSTEDIFLRKQALGILARQESSRKKAIEALLFISNIFGLKNKILEENINIITGYGFEEARVQIIKFSQAKVFWKRDLKIAALKALANWHDRTN